AESAATIGSVAYAPDGRAIAIGAEDGSIIVQDVHSGERRSIRPQGAAVRTLCFSPDSLLLATGGDDRAICIWNLAAETLEHHSFECSGVPSGVRFDPSGRTLFVGI